MVYLIEDSLFPIIDGKECVGQGFVADGYFITAAHIIKHNPNCFIEIGERKIILSKETPLYIGRGDMENDPNVEDIVIYNFGLTTGFLHLSSRKLQSEDTLRTVLIAVNYNNITNLYHKDLVVWEAVYVGQDEGNYFYCKCHSNAGCSGSPLIVGNEVVGILHGGNDNDLCAFLKPSSFMYPEGVYNGCVVRWCSDSSPRKEPWTPAYFNRRAREQMSDAFECESDSYWNIE